MTGQVYSLSLCLPEALSFCRQKLYIDMPKTGNNSYREVLNTVMKKVFAGYRQHIRNELNRRRIENHYYSMGNDKKSFGARWIDRLLSALFVFFLGLTAAVLTFDNIYLALVLGTVITSIYYLAVRTLSRRRVTRGKERLVREATVKKFADRVSGMSDRDFCALVKSLLEKSRCFAEMEPVEDSGESPVLLEGYFNGNRIGVYCMKVDGKENVKLHQLREFVEICTDRGLNQGLYITNGYFDHSSKEYAGVLEDFMLYIGDMDSIYTAFLKKDLYLSRGEIERQIEAEIIDTSQAFEYRLRKMLAYKRIRTYVVLGLLLAGYSHYVDFTVCYIIVSIIFLSLAATAFIRWNIEKYKGFVEKEIRLEQNM